MLRLLVLPAVAAATAAPVPAAYQDRVSASWDGLQRYFFNETGGFWKSCGQTGGAGGAVDNFNCECEAGFCTNCYRWWMVPIVQSLVQLNAAGHEQMRNATLSLTESMWALSPYTTRRYVSWAYIDDYLWFVLMWLDVYDWLGDSRYLTEASDTFEVMWQWGSDEPCGGVIWMYPDVDPRKNSITLLETVQAAARLAVRQAGSDKGAERSTTALKLWAWFEEVGLLGERGLVLDNVTGVDKFHCCNRTSTWEGLGTCSARNTVSWSYTQGMLLGAVTDLHALTSEERFLEIGAGVLDAVVQYMRRADGSLTEPLDFEIELSTCDKDHDPSAPAGGDLFSFKGVFMVQLPRFLQAARHVLAPDQLAAAKRLVSASANAAWSARATPPFPPSDICNEFVKDLPSNSAPKFTWDWSPPSTEGLTCMDSRTQGAAFSLFAADQLLSEAAARAGATPAHT